MKTFKSYILITATVSVLAIGLAHCGGGGGGSSSNRDANNSTVSLSGIAATGSPIASAAVTMKDSNGLLKTTVTDTAGKYSFDITGMTAPFLIKVSSVEDNFYSVATTAGTANIHPFTDLIIRNWYKVNGSDVDTVFGGTGSLPSPPTAAGISTIETVMRNILSTWLLQEGLDASSFNLITSSFDANESGFDEVLEYTEVAIDAADQVTVKCTDPNTGIGNTMVSENIVDLAATDTTPPSDPGGLRAIGADRDKIVLLWDASTDGVGISGYNIYRADTKIGKAAYSVYFDSTGLAPNTAYCYQVEAFDGAGNVSASRSGQACASTLAVPDTTPPSIPTALTATPASATQINLAWTASTDNTYVLSYKVYRGGHRVGTAPSTNFVDAELSANTQYCYTAKAVDAAGNVSLATSEVCVTTLSP